jgi:hypothetical protein
MANQKPTAATPPAEDGKKKQLTPGVRMGRAIEKIATLYADEEAELAAYPQSIREKFAKKRSEALDGLSDAERKQVLAAVNALRPEPETKAAE